MKRNVNDEAYFIVIVDAGSTTGAATQLGLTQPALSKCLKRLRSEYSDRLVKFQDGKAEMTLVGRLLYEYANRAKIEKRRHWNRVQLALDNAFGLVNVGLGGYAAEASAAEAFARWIEKYPKFRAQFHVMGGQHLHRLLEEDRLDFYFANYMPEQMDHTLEVLKAPTFEMTFFVRPGHPLANRDMVMLSDVVKYPTCTVPGPDKFTKKITREIGEMALSTIDDIHISGLQCSDVSVYKSIVQKTDSVGFLPINGLREEISRGAVVLLNTNFKWPDPELAVVSLKKRAMPEPARHLADLLLEEFSKDLTHT